MTVPYPDHPAGDETPIERNAAMTETPPEAVVEEKPEGSHVYDLAELRYVDNAPGKTATQTANDLNAANKNPKVGRADGKRGPRYEVR